MSKIFEFTDESKNIPEWKDNLEGISSNHTQVTGVLAGFSFTAVVLVSTCPDRSMNPFLAEATFGLFLMAFYGYVITAILYSFTIERVKLHQYFLFSIASLLYYFSVVLSFSAILTLCRLLKYEIIQKGVIITISSAIIGR